MLNICIIAHNRPRLLQQCIDSLVWHTMGPANITVIDDGSGPETEQLLQEFASRGCWNFELARNAQAVGPGRARNQSIELSQVRWGRGDMLYLADSDCYFMPGWDRTLLAAWPLAASAGFRALGAYAHSYQRPIRQFHAMAGYSVNELAALGLLSWLMAWETWDQFGSFEPSTTINGSEDWNYSQRIRKSGGMVGVLDPAVVVNCGATSSNGKPCPGTATLYEQNIPAGVVIE